MAAPTQSFCGISPTKWVCFLLIFTALQCSQGMELPTPSMVKGWAEAIGNGLDTLISDQQIQDLTDEFGKTPAAIEYKEIDETALIEEMAKSLAEMLLKKMEALNRSVAAAEDFVRNHNWNQSFEKGDVSFPNTKSGTMDVGNDRQNWTVEWSDRFGKEINVSYSSVHIPVEIYEGNNDILHGLNWTTQLTSQFEANYKNDPDILWQYFGSQSGFMRTYPASYWNNDGVDLYDVRRQSWYTQGSSSPKDMMILVDTSGSTFGQSLQLMKNAVKSILNTLGENDFVNVAQFSTEAKFVGKCFNHTAFVQANYRNKKQLERDVDSLQAYGQADFNVAIRFAFEKFAEFSSNETDDENNMGANCNKVIMLLTDGGTDNAEEVFKQYNSPNKTVRVFTYAVGPTPNPIQALRWMACNNRGYFSQIPAMGAIRARVQGYTKYLKESKEMSGAQDVNWELTFDPREYIPVLSRPQVIKNKKTFQWGNIYQDHLGLGMMTTVTLPVYNTSLGSSRNQTILGVMGVDVTTALLEAQTPFEKIGPNGYTFAINPNGYVVFHPGLRTKGKFMKEPPNIDLMELEIGDETESEMLLKLRTSMIDGSTGKMAISSLFLSPDQRYVTRTECSYAFLPVDHTTFKLGLNIPSYQKKYRKVNLDIKTLDWPDIANADYGIYVAPWKFLKGKTKTGEPITLQELIQEVNANNDPSKWHLQRLLNLYWDSKVLHEVGKSLKPDNTSESNDPDLEMEESGPRKSTFIMTSGGLLLVYPKNETGSFEKMRDLKKSSLFTRTLYAQKRILMAEHSEGPRPNASSSPAVYMTVPIPLNKDGTPYDIPAVTGTRIPHEEIMKIVNKQINANLPDDDDVMTCEDPDLLCYLVDDGGFVLATNRDDHKRQVGRFLGQVDSQLMSALNGTVYDRQSQYAFQSSCKKTEDTLSAGFRSFTIPTFSLLTEFLSVGFWTTKVSWVFSTFSIYSWLTTPVLEVEANADEDDEYKECVMVVNQYFLVDELPKNLTMNSLNTSQCENCTRSLLLAKVPDSNALFIITDPICEECSQLYPTVSQAPREITSEEEEATICELARNPYKRVQAYQCYHEDTREDQAECGCSSLKLSQWSLFITLICIAWVWSSQSR